MYKETLVIDVIPTKKKKKRKKYTYLHTYIVYLVYTYTYIASERTKVRTGVY